jgi:hypothetical protein
MVAVDERSRDGNNRGRHGMGSRVNGSLKDGMSSGEDGGRNQGQVPQRGIREELLE